MSVFLLFKMGTSGDFINFLQIRALDEFDRLFDFLRVIILMRYDLVLSLYPSLIN